MTATGPEPEGEPPGQAPEDRRADLDRFLEATLRRAKVFERVSLFSMLVGSAAIVTADFVLAFTRNVTLGFTIAETVLVLPWAIYILRLDRQEQRLRGDVRKQRTRMAAVHAIVIGMLVLCIVEKWLVLERARAGETVAVLASYRIYTIAAWTFVNVGLIGRGSRFARLLVTLADHPARLSALSFGLTALLGGFALTLPQALRNIHDASFINGLFTAMSAVCVTGLVVNNVSATYTSFGQGVIFGLFQAGGLGIMVLSAAFAILAGRRLRLRSSAVLAEMVDVESLASLRRSVLSIIVYTLVIEALGALLLWWFFHYYPDVLLGPTSSKPLAGAGSYVWAAVFHSVSAFCNAGFSLFNAGAVPFAGSWAVSLTIAGLIVLGGIGFPVLDELTKAAWKRFRGRRPPRLSLHTRVVLITTALLIVFLALAYLVLEWNNTMAGRPFDEKILTSIFQSITPRTAGFNTLDYGAMRPATIVLTCIFMFIGASPGSTGGGVKTTTLAVLFATFRSELRGLDEGKLLDRTVPQVMVRRAMGVLFMSLLIVSIMYMVLLVTEPMAPLRLAFEVFSAFGTVGLSTGITAALSVPGKIVIILTMFVGRIGPLTLALAFAARQRRPAYQLPHERVMIG